MPSSPDSASDDAPDIARAPGPKPLSRRASRWFVIASILFVIAATAGSTYYLIRMTSQALTVPADTTVTDTSRAEAAPDTLR